MRTPTIFETEVYEALRRIPPGKVTTYSILARYLGKPRGARAVGNALNRNPYAPEVPCHRVVTYSGALGGYAFGITKKIALLRQEGVQISHNMIDLEQFGYRFDE
jgi:methylated-DNA-[protein]-cysteine S-methyltransferase